MSSLHAFAILFSGCVHMQNSKPVTWLKCQVVHLQPFRPQVEISFEISTCMSCFKCQIRGLIELIQVLLISKAFVLRTQMSWLFFSFLNQKTKFCSAFDFWVNASISALKMTAWFGHRLHANFFTEIRTLGQHTEFRQTWNPKTLNVVNISRKSPERTGDLCEKV